MFTFWEFFGLFVIVLYKYKTNILNLFQSLQQRLFSPPPKWVIVEDICNTPFQVGETVRLNIRYVHAAQEMFQEDLAHLRIELNQNAQTIVHLKEVVAEEKTVIIKFSIQNSAVPCKIELYERNKSIIGPVNIKFLPGPPDPDKTTCVRPCPIIQCTTFIDKCIYIQARDKFENHCTAKSIDLNAFQFQANVADGSLEIDHLSDGLGVYTATFSCQKYSTQVQLKLNFNYPGIFNGAITYKNQMIGGYGSFGIVCISNSEETSLQYILANSPSWKYHEGRLLVVNNHIQSRTKKIYIYVSQKQIYVQEYILKFIPIRIATFRVSSMTKMELLFADDDQNTYTFTMHDGIQPKVTIEMDKSQTRIVYAMFTHFLQKRHGGSESFTDKQKFFYNELRDVRNKQGNLRLSFISVRINRQDIVKSTLQSTYYYNSKDWCKNFGIEFVGEEGLDGGGLRREWIDLICIKLFENNEYGLFCAFGNSRLVHPNSTVLRHSYFTKRHYELAGKIVGKCLYESAVGDSYKAMVNGRFTRSFLAQILGLRPNYKHFEQDDPELYLGKIKFILENDVDKMELTFTDEEYKPNGQLLKSVDLVSNGSKKMVTNDNKEDYLNALANYRLGTRVKKEIEAFCEGLHEIVPDELLSQFDENELELLMCGKSEFSVDDLKKHYAPSFTLGFDSAYGRVLEWFWIVVANMTDDEKAKLLQFITGSSLLPHGGFAKLSPRLRIMLDSNFGKLPTASTCANQLVLSDNISFESFKKCLLLAVNEGSQGFAFK